MLIAAGGVTLAGGPDDVWIFQITQDLTVASQGFLTLVGGAKPANVFWQVAGKTALGTMSRMKGVVLCPTQIVMNAGARLSGRALAQSSVTRDSSTLMMGAGDKILIDGFQQLL